MNKLIPFLFCCLIACENPSDGPQKIRWDRQTCERCAMSIGDLHYAAQIRSPQGQYYSFDDIGCAVIWLEQQPWKDDPQTRIWVKDYQSGDWLDARQARYIENQITPMAYGLGANKEQGLSFAEAKQRIFEIEAQIHAQRGQKP